jgi:hypothetical protein
VSRSSRSVQLRGQLVTLTRDPQSGQWKEGEQKEHGGEGISRDVAMWGCILILVGLGVVRSLFTKLVLLCVLLL